MNLTSPEKPRPENNKELTSVDKVSSWLNDLEENHQLEHIHPEIVRECFSQWGADFESLTQESKQALQKYKRGNKKTGIDEIWGENFYEKYVKMTELWTKDYESNPENRNLPGLSKSGKKNAGMVQLLGELTAYAANSLDFDELQERLETRVFNGFVSSQGRPKEKKRIKVPTAGKSIKPASIPPGFIPDFIDYLSKPTSEI